MNVDHDIVKIADVVSALMDIDAVMGIDLVDGYVTDVDDFALIPYDVLALMDDDSIDYFELVDGCYVTDVDDFEFVFNFKIHINLFFILSLFVWFFIILIQNY